MARKYDEAIKAFNDALNLEPGYPFARSNLWVAYYLTDQTEKAYTTLKSFWSMDPGSLETFERGYLKDGLRGALLSLTDRLGGLWTENQGQFFTPFDIALFYSAAGETDQSLLWLEQAYKFRDPNLPYLLFPLFDHLRTNPRFRDLCSVMKLPCAG